MIYAGGEVLNCDQRMNKLPLLLLGLLLGACGVLRAQRFDLTSGRVIHEQIRGLGHIPIIDAHPRRDLAHKAELQAEEKRRTLLNFNYAEDMRYRERTTVERVNARLKDEFGGRTIRVRGNAKVMCHLMFGIIALTADQILRLIT